jgi:acetamidase/formamidase
MQDAMSASTDSDDIRDVDLTRVHNLSGPVAVEGAEPGDCLVVDILDGMVHVELVSLNAHQQFCL